MRKLLVVLGLLGAVAAHSSADAQEIQFYGAVQIIAQAGTCPFGDQVGQRFTGRFRPRDGAENPHSDLNFFSDGFVLGHRRLNSNFSTSFLRVQATFVGGGSGTQAQADSTTFVKFNSVPAITDTTTFVNITGQIKGYDSQPDCTVTFRFAGTKRL